MANLLDEVLAEKSPPTDLLDEVISEKSQPSNLLDDVISEKSSPTYASSKENISALESKAEEYYKKNKVLDVKAERALKEAKRAGLNKQAENIKGMQKSIDTALDGSLQTKSGFTTTYDLAKASGTSPEDLRSLTKQQREAKAEAFRLAQEERKRNPNIFNKAGEALYDIYNPLKNAAGTVIDTSGRVTRNAIAASAGLGEFHPIDALMNKPGVAGVDATEYNYQLENAKSAPAVAAKAILDASGDALIRPVITAGNYAADVLNPFVKTDIAKSWKQAGPASHAMSRILGSDLGVAFSAGGKGAAILEGQLGRLAKAGKLSEEAAGAFKSQALAHSLERGGAISSGQQLVELAKAHKIPEQAISNVIGKSGELAGRAGGKFLGRQIAIPGVPEQAVSRGVNYGMKQLGALGEKIAPNVSGFRAMQLPPAEREALMHVSDRARYRGDVAGEKFLGGQYEKVQGNEEIQKIFKEHPDVLKAEKEALEKEARRVAGKARSKEMNDFLNSPEVTSLSNETKRNINNYIAASRKPIGKTVSFFNKVNDFTTPWIRKVNLAVRPGFYTENLKGDMFNAAAHDALNFQGLKAGKNFIANAPLETVAVNTKYAKLSIGDIIKELQEQGAWGTATGESRSATGMLPNARAIGKELKTAAGIKPGIKDLGVEGIANRTTLGLADKTKAAWEKIENAEKISVYSSLRAKGLAPAAATQAMYDAGLYNYRSGGLFPGAMAGAKAVNPFATWGYKSLKQVPLGYLQSPTLSRLGMSSSLGIDVNDKSQTYPVPDYATESAWQIPLGESARGLYNAASKAITGTAYPTGMGLKAGVRDPTIDVGKIATSPEEATSPIGEAMKTYISGTDRQGKAIPPGGRDMAEELGRQILSTLTPAHYQLAYKTWAKLYGKKNYFTGSDEGEKDYSKQSILSDFLRYLASISISPAAPGMDIQSEIYSKENQNLKRALELAGPKIGQHKKAERKKKIKDTDI